MSRLREKGSYDAVYHGPPTAIVIGSSREQKLPSLVLEHTIEKNSRYDIPVIHTYGLRFPDPKSPKHRSRTGFSFARFAIPGLVGYRGRAAYLECDQIVFKDPAELLGLPFDGATVLRTRVQTSVLLMDCDRLRWDLTEIIAQLDAEEYTYHGLMEDLCVEPKENVKCSIPSEWNSLEKYVEGKTALLHYTNMDLQPWRKWWDHPLKDVWIREFRSALEAGMISLQMVQDEADLGHVVPELIALANSWARR